MPLYSYQCGTCGKVHDLRRRVEDRRMNVSCVVCGSYCKRVVERCNIVTFEPYYDEGLGSDVYSAADRRAIMKLRGVHEAGDAEHGARNFDPKAPMLVDKQPLKGVRPRITGRKDFPVATVDGVGAVKEEKMFSTLPVA
jgi:putative FmdB family regulatory protein